MCCMETYFVHSTIVTFTMVVANVLVKPLYQQQNIPFKKKHFVNVKYCCFTAISMHMEG